jgi:EpsI family protein
MICTVFIGSGLVMRNLPGCYHLPAGISFDSFPVKIGKWTRVRSYPSKYALSYLRADDGLLAAYSSSSIRNPLHLFIAFYEYQTIYRTAHAPQSCNLYGGWSSIGSKKASFDVDRTREISVMIHSLEKEGVEVLVGSFFYQRGRMIASPWMNKVYLFWDAMTKRRTDGAVVRAEVVLLPGQSYKEAYPALEDFLIDLHRVLQDYVPA